MAERRIHALDAFRGFAALWVVLYHVTIRYPYYMLGLNTPDTPLVAWAPLGFTQAEMGVVPVLWFFLISGFVITWTIDRCRTPMDFLVSRVSRLYPAFWAALGVSVLLGVVWPLPGTEITVGQVAANVTMLQEFIGVPAVDGVYWSLTVELRFYCYALLVFVLGQWRRVHLVALAWSMLCVAVAVLNGLDVWVPWRVQQALMTQYGPFLVSGMMVYQLWRRHHVAASWVTLGCSVAAILVGYRLLPAATCIVAMGLLAWSAHGGMRWLAFPPLLWLGTISYSLYLSHENATFTLIRALDGAGTPHGVSAAVAVGAALLLASAISYGVEQPAMRFMRDAWRRRRPPSAPADEMGGPVGARSERPQAPG